MGSRFIEIRRGNLCLQTGVLTSRRPSEFERHVVPDGAAVFGGGDAHVDEAELFVIMDEPFLAGEDEAAAASSSPSR